MRTPADELPLRLPEREVGMMIQEIAELVSKSVVRGITLAQSFMARVVSRNGNVAAEITDRLPGRFCFYLAKPPDEMDHRFGHQILGIASCLSTEHGRHDPEDQRPGKLLHDTRECGFDLGIRRRTQVFAQETIAVCRNHEEVNFFAQVGPGSLTIGTDGYEWRPIEWMPISRFRANGERSTSKRFRCRSTASIRCQQRPVQFDHEIGGAR